MSDKFIQIRKGLLYHLKDGKMTMPEFAVYSYLHLIALFQFGRVKTSAAHIYYDTQETLPSIRAVQRLLESLEKKRYIKRFMVNGKKGDYQILIHKYQATDGAWKGLYLNAWKTTEWTEPVFEERVDDDVDSNVDNDVDGDVGSDVGSGGGSGEFVKKVLENGSKDGLQDGLQKGTEDDDASGGAAEETGDYTAEELEAIRQLSVGGSR